MEQNSEQIDQEYYLIQLKKLGDTSEKLKEIAHEIRGVVESLKKFNEKKLSANLSIPLFIETLPRIQERSLKISESLIMLFQKSTGDDDFKDHLLYVAIDVNKKLIDLLSEIIHKFLQFRLTDDIKSIDNYDENVFMIQQTSKQLSEFEDFVKRNTINLQSTSKGGKSRRRRRSRHRHHFSIKYKFGKKHCKKSRRRSHRHSNKKSRKSRRGHRVHRR